MEGEGIVGMEGKAGERRGREEREMVRNGRWESMVQYGRG